MGLMRQPLQRGFFTCFKTPKLILGQEEWKNEFFFFGHMSLFILITRNPSALGCAICLIGTLILVMQSQHLGFKIHARESVVCFTLHVISHYITKHRAYVKSSTS